MQWVPGALSLGLKRPGRKADHSPPSSAEIKKAGGYTSTAQYAFMAWWSVKAQGQLYLYLIEFCCEIENWLMTVFKGVKSYGSAV
jgi:hypothetical protein